MNHITFGTVLACVLFLGMFGIMELGRRIGERNLHRDPDGAKVGVGVVEGAVFGLLGLLMAFTFSGAATRFDTRRQLVVEEANDIGTAWLRLDVLPPAAAEPLRSLFRGYLDSRIDAYLKLPDVKAAEAECARSMKLQSEIGRSLP